MKSSTRILLASVFGPFGVDDQYGRKENIIELFHNQVTREQGLFSLRFQHQSFGLYMIAENLEADVTVLDFPSQKRFIREIRKDYDYVGISFIVPNFIKAKKMTELVRAHAPKSKIVLGGHGTRIDDIETKIDFDHVCYGEGIRFFRELLKENPDRKISHPIIPAAFNQRLMGIPLYNASAVLMPGVGCPNGCRFCCTSHFFNKEYTPFLQTGKEIFEVCERAEREHGFDEFFVMDENFLKHETRVREFMDELEKHDKHYQFSIFSSAEAVKKVGVDFMARLGVTFLWLGMEGKRSEYDKNKGIDLKELVRELREAGITVLGSIILFTEQHDKNTIQKDIDFAIDAAPDFIQFMQLGPLPGTALYKDYDKKGILRKDIPFEEWHGQHQIWFDHPNFTAKESEEYTKKAFQQAWDELGCSLLRLIETNLLGYKSTLNAKDQILQKRNLDFKKTCKNYYPALEVIIRHAHNDFEKHYAQKVKKNFDETFGKASLLQKTLEYGARAFAAVEATRIAIKGNLRQPKTVVTRFLQPAPIFATSVIPGIRNLDNLQCDVNWNQGRLSVKLGGVMDAESARSLAKKIVEFYRTKKGRLVIDIQALKDIKDDSLSALLLKIKRYHKKLVIIYDHSKTDASELVERAAFEFANLKFQPAVS